MLNFFPFLALKLLLVLLLSTATPFAGTHGPDRTNAGYHECTDHEAEDTAEVRAVTR
jgi:hypothetical protein